MRKRVTSPVPKEGPAGPEAEWLDLEQLAQVEVTSEDAAYPIESALVPGEGSGWRAAQPGEQTIRLVFDRPQRVRRMWLLFIEPDTTRTQEFALRWSPDGGRSFREILRQQWNFGPPETIREMEDYRVELGGVTVLELAIVPDKNGGEARASLAQWRLAG
ncbi:MAG TPA: carbohydrate-binding protein [Methylomirabilota bacterium]|nr:carbohydrate-binding protein [Methylomirabilota bacterium]